MMDYMVAPNEPHTIHPNGDPTQCLEVQGGQFRSGTPVQTFYCNGTPAQQWKISRGTTTVQVDVAPFCLDAGADPHPGVPVKIWQCFPNLPAQTWFYTADNRIALKDTGYFSPIHALLISLTVVCRTLPYSDLPPTRGDLHLLRQQLRPSVDPGLLIGLRFVRNIIRMEFVYTMDKQ
ncbi:hypothetical protein DXG01_003206 [Tephrocybe rancida]|nr:hypothetical protein DXG01_003206 [Tephrocybe rancida]